MKRMLTTIIYIICLTVLVACSHNTTGIPASEKNTAQENDLKIAVVYFSATGNTKAVAELIADEAKADIYEIIPDKKYTEDDLDYNNDNCRANLEMKDDASRPSIKNDLSAITEYDVIYLGYPVWWGTNPKIIQTVLDKYDISNSKIYTFCTSGGSGIESSISDLQTMYSNLNIVAGKRFDNPTEEDVKAWLESIG